MYILSLSVGNELNKNNGIVVDETLYQVFRGKKLNLDRFALPEEYYGIASHFLDN